MTPKTPRFIAHLISVGLIAVAVLVATGDGFAQSYAGLYHWALEHSLHGWKAESFPLMVDLFILVGEIGLFALALEGHKLSRHWLPWADLALPGGIAAGGWGVSLAFNVGAVGPDVADRLTAAVPPVASMLGLLVLLRTLHRLVGRARPVVAEVAECGHRVAMTLDEAVRAAVGAGLSQRKAEGAFGIPRTRVKAIIDQARPPADEVAGMPLSVVAEQS